MSNTTPIHRIKLLIEDKKMNISTFEKIIGASTNSIGQAVRRNTDVKADTLIQILSAFPDVDAEWLLMGNGEMYKVDKDSDNYIDDETIARLDLISKRDIVMYLKIKQEEFDQLAFFRKYKKELTKDGVIEELMYRMRNLDKS